MHKIRLGSFFAVVFWLLAVPFLAWSDDCSSQGDCMQTAGYNAVMAVAGGALGMLAALYGSHLAGLISTSPRGPAAPAFRLIPRPNLGSLRVESPAPLAWELEVRLRALRPAPEHRIEAPDNIVIGEEIAHA